MKREAEEFLVTGCQFLVTQNSKPKTQNFSKREAGSGKQGAGSGEREAGVFSFFSLAGRPAGELMGSTSYGNGNSL